MKIISTLHNHSTLCDGKSTLPEMAAAAVKLGFTDLGFSGHSHASFDLAYSIKSEADYVRAVGDVRREFADRLRIWCGIEQDYYAPVVDRRNFDYLIGSVHCMRDERLGKYIYVDGSSQEFADDVKHVFSGDAIAFAARYYEFVGDMAERDRPDIIGHFDLVTKNNADGRFFDEENAGYRACALDALLRCARTGAVFELNTGAMARGYRDTPYPARFLIKRLLELRAPVTLSSDCHDASKLVFGLLEATELLKDVGFRTVQVWENGAFVTREL